MIYKLIIIGVPVCIAFGASVTSFAKEKTGMAGAAFLVVVIFAHVFEAFALIPSLGWGQQNSSGHYIDLISAFAGAVLFPLGYLGRRYSRRINSR